MNGEMLTTKEVAEYLNINEKQVYRLIKEKRIPATRITGKWLFPKRLIDDWLIKSAQENLGISPRRVPSDQQVVIAGSNDLALELLAKNAHAVSPGLALSIANVGSLGGLVALQSGKCHIAACHLLDTETGEYNSSFIRKHFPELRVTVQNLSHREQGLIVRKGNPLRIKGLQSLVKRKATFVNRQEGSGTRVLLDYKLSQMGIASADIKGYSNIAHTHMDVALEVFSGSADAGIGILAVAKLLGLGFIPLATERFDLIFSKESNASEAGRALHKVLCSDEFKSSVTRMGGYNTRDTGRTLYERE
jgi:putative molybdopterin biosynthesis protein